MGRFLVSLSELQPSQLFLSVKKLAYVQSWLDRSTLETYEPLPVKDLCGKIVLTDGHTRAFALHLLGETHIRVAWDEDDMDWAAYRICVGWCLKEGISTVMDLVRRLLDQDDYERLWIQRCEQMHSALENVSKEIQEEESIQTDTEQPEWFDLTDEARQPLGRLHCRGKEVTEGYYHTVVGIWVVDGSGRILVTLRHPDKGWGGFWECPGGAVVAGETSRQGACRELAEETGLAFPEERFGLLGTMKYRTWFTDSYRVSTDVLQPEVVCQPGEVVGYRWADDAEILSLIEEKVMVPAMGDQYLKYRTMLGAAGNQTEQYEGAVPMI